MKHTTVVIIGGGATGIGILRDLSMRGIASQLYYAFCPIKELLRMTPSHSGIAFGSFIRLHPKVRFRLSWRA